jgi:hypothetical protein
VVIDEPKGRGLGGEVAAPVFSSIVERIVRGPAREVVLRPGGPTGDEWIGDRRERGGAAAANGGGSRGAVPAVAAGQSAPEAVLAADARIFDEPLDAAALWARDNDAGAAPCEDGNAIVPDLRGMSIRHARRLAAAAGLEFGCDGTGVVRTQTPRPGAKVPSGHRVAVTCYPR